MATLSICRHLALAFILSSLALAQSPRPQDYAKSADRKADRGDFKGAIEDYNKAIAAETNARRKQKHEEDLVKVKQRFYRNLVETAAKLTSRQNKINLLTEARELGIEDSEGKLGGVLGIGGKDFSEVVEEGKSAREKIILELGKELREEEADKNFDGALSIYEQAYRLDPDLSQSLTEIRDSIRGQMERGKRLAEQAWQQLEAKQHQLAKELFDQAESAFPGQDRVQAGRRQIRAEVAEYGRLKSRAEQLGRSDPAAAVDAYQAAMKIHPELGRSDKLRERIHDLGLGLRKDQAWDAFKMEDYTRSQGLFEELLSLNPNDEDARLGRDRSISAQKLEEAKRLSRRGLHQKARKLLHEAKQLDPENSQAANLLASDNRYLSRVAEGRKLFKKSQEEHSPEDCERALARFRQARKLNPGRFGKEGLDALVDEGDCAAVIPLPFEKLTAGLDSYLDGQPLDAIDYLEAALEEVGEGRVEVHALLGAAYCFSGLYQGGQESEELEKGRQQFRLALNIDPDYRLSESLFSPRILRILEEVRAELQVGQTEAPKPNPTPPGDGR